MALLIIIAGAALGVTVGTWLLMLVLGWVSTFLPFVPALGFFQTLGVVLLLNFIGAALGWNRTKA